jgi:hypothetical protein
MSDAHCRNADSLLHGLFAIFTEQEARGGDTGMAGLRGDDVACCGAGARLMRLAPISTTSKALTNRLVGPVIGTGKATTCAPNPGSLMLLEDIGKLPVRCNGRHVVKTL